MKQSINGYLVCDGEPLAEKDGVLFRYLPEDGICTLGFTRTAHTDAAKKDR